MHKTASESPSRSTINFLIMTAVVAGLIVLMIRGRGSKSGICAVDSTSLKAICKSKNVISSIPQDISVDIIALTIGDSLDKTDNNLRSLSKVNFTRYQALQELSLIKCGIEEILSDAFSNTKFLRLLDLRFNRIQNVAEATFTGLSNLDYLDLSNNPIEMLPDFFVRGLRIEQLIMANNPALRMISDKAFAGSIVRKLMISRGNLKQLGGGLFSFIKESLQELTITHNLRPLAITEDAFEGLKLTRLSLAGDDLTNVEFLKHLFAEEVILDDNLLYKLDLDNSSKLQSIVKLSLRNVRLNKLDKKNLSTLINIKELLLSENELTILDSAIFEDLHKLTTLDLSRNDITDLVINADGNSFPALKVLHLDNNPIQTLPQNLRTLFTRLENLTLSGTPLHCNCELRWFAEWLDSHRHAVSDLDSVQCATPDRLNLTLIPDQGFHCRLPKILNATFDGDGFTLVCTADGDPAPAVAWFSPNGDENPPSLSNPFDRQLSQTRSLLTVTKHGNYTCSAESLAGKDVVVIDTRRIPSSGLKFNYESQEIEILESPQGFFVTLGLLTVLGYILRHS